MDIVQIATKCKEIWGIECNGKGTVVAQSRFPGTKMKRQHTAVSRSRNMPRTERDRLFRVFCTNGSRMWLKSMSVYSLRPSSARIGSSIYWWVKMK